MTKKILTYFALIGLFRAIYTMEIIYLLSSYLLHDPIRTYVITLFLTYVSLLVMMTVVDSKGKTMPFGTDRSIKIFLLKVGIPAVVSAIFIPFFIF